MWPRVPARSHAQETDPAAGQYGIPKMNMTFLPCVEMRKGIGRFIGLSLIWKLTQMMAFFLETQERLIKELVSEQDPERYVGLSMMRVGK